MSSVPYSPTFEDEVMNAILDPSPSSDSAVPASDAPEIPSSVLPLPLSDARRVHASKLPGVQLTEPKGSLFGGSISQQLRKPNGTAASTMASTPAQSPPPPPTTTPSTTDADASRDDILAALAAPLPVSSRPTQTQLARALNAASDAQLAELRKRMRARKEALLANARVERELADLKAQRDVEVKIEKRMREEAGQRDNDD